MRGLGIRRQSAAAVVLTAALVGSLVAVTASPAGAAYECGQLVTSPPDDAPNNARGGDGGNVDNLDIVAAGVNADDGTTLKVAVGVKELSNDVPTNATSINWYFRWTYGDTIYFGRAVINATAPDTVTYGYGTFDPTTSRYTQTATTEGAFNTGEKGTVEIHVPYEGVGEPPAGTNLTEVVAITFIGQGVPGAVSTLSQVDRGPKEEDTYGADYTAGNCSGGGGGDGTTLASPKAGLGFNDKTPKRGATVTATARLKVCGDHAGTTIELQRKAGTKFKKVASKALSAKCTAKFKVVANFKSATFRSYWPRQDEDHRAGQSKPVTVTTH